MSGMSMGAFCSSSDVNVIVCTIVSSNLLDIIDIIGHCITFASTADIQNVRLFGSETDVTKGD